MNRIGLWCLLVLATEALTGCESDAGADAAGEALTGRLTVTGSSTVAPLMSEIAQRFEAEHLGVRIDVQTGGSSRGVIDTQRGTADIGMVSRELLDTERAELRSHAIARDGIGVIVHADNPVESLSDEQIRRIFTGRLTSWHEVSAGDRAITVVNKADGRATLDAFSDHYGLRSADVRPDVVIGENQHGIKTVASDRGAIGYVSLGAAEVEIARGASIRVLPIGGADGTLANLRAGTYPLSRPLILVTQRNKTPLVDAFTAFALSEANHDLIEAFSYVPAD